MNALIVWTLLNNITLIVYKYPFYIWMTLFIHDEIFIGEDACQFIQKLSGNNSSSQLQPGINTKAKKQQAAAAVDGNPLEAEEVDDSNDILGAFAK